MSKLCQYGVNILGSWPTHIRTYVHTWGLQCQSCNTVHLPHLTSESTDKQRQFTFQRQAFLPKQHLMSGLPSAACIQRAHFNPSPSSRPSTDHAHLLVQLPPGAKEVTQYTCVLVTLSLQKGGGAVTQLSSEPASRTHHRGHKAVSHWQMLSHLTWRGCSIRISQPGPVRQRMHI